LNNEATHINYTLVDIERYLQGKMNATEMYAIEKAALQDPFLADAIEGYSQADHSIAHQHLNQITATLLGAKENSKVVTMPIKNNNWWKVAAAVTIVIGASSIAVWLMNSNSQNENSIAQIQTVKEKDSSVTITTKDTNTLKIDGKANTISSQNSIATPNFEVQIDSANTTDNGTYAFTTTQPAKKLATNDADGITEKLESNAYKAEDKMAKADFKSSADDKAKEVAVEKNLSVVNGFITKDEANKPATPLIAQAKRSANDVAGNSIPPAVNNYGFTNAAPAANNNQSRKFTEMRGRVLNTNGEPLSYANVQVNGSNNYRAATYTDANGNFAVKAYDTTAVADVAIVGYAQQNVNLSASRANTIVLQESNTLAEEVVVTNLGKQRSASNAITQKEKNTTAQPEGGWQSFQDYVYKKLHKENEKDTLANSDVVAYGRQVDVEFNIDEKGKPYNVKIIQSSGEEEKDTQVVEAVKKGPRWIAGERKKKKAKAKVRLKL
jgi:TonB family protein